VPTPNEITAAKFVGQPADKTLVDVDPREETVRLVNPVAQRRMQEAVAAAESTADWAHIEVHAPRSLPLEELKNAGPSRLAPTVAALRDECQALTTENNRLHVLLTESRRQLDVRDQQIARQCETIQRQQRTLADVAEYRGWAERYSKNRDAADRAAESLDAAKAPLVKGGQGRDHKKPGWSLLEITIYGNIGVLLIVGIAWSILKLAGWL
jgi:hypothetical protein